MLEIRNISFKDLINVIGRFNIFDPNSVKVSSEPRWPVIRNVNSLKRLGLPDLWMIV